VGTYFDHQPASRVIRSQTLTYTSTTSTVLSTTFTAQTYQVRLIASLPSARSAAAPMPDVRRARPRAQKKPGAYSSRRGWIGTLTRKPCVKARSSSA
jgi:hypothetical protein